jgi:uncharacterized membrane protein
VSDAEWRFALDALIDQVRSGYVGDGFIAAISRANLILKEHLPLAPDAPERFPDRLHLV